MLFLIKNFFRIFRNYKLSSFLLIFFEIFYFFRGFKGFKFNFSINDHMTDNIPCPYYFLFKIKNDLSNNSFEKLIDLGCGSGRIIDFFNNNFYNKKFVGIEFFDAQYEHCRNIFKNQKNIEIIQGDFTKIDLDRSAPDCFFISAPFKKSIDFLNFMKNLINASSNKKRLFIIINYDKNIISNLKGLECLKSFYIANGTGYSICYNINV